MAGPVGLADAAVSMDAGVSGAPAMTPSRRRWTMVAVVLGSAVVFLDTSVVNLALPRIGEELPSDLFGTLEAQSYVAYGYFVTLSALLILAGGLTDYHGRRKMFSLGLIGFAATSLLCGVAPSMEFLIVARVLQGAAGALVVPGSLAIITASFDGEERGRAFGVWAGASAATTILGPFIGGMLVNTISWRMAFLVNLPLLAVAYLATIHAVPESRDPNATGHFDWLGSAVIVLAVGGLAFGTIRGEQQGWGEPVAVGSLVVGGIAAIVFPFLMLRRRDPLVPPRLFRSRNFTVTNLATLVIYGALYVSLTFEGIFLIGTLGYNEQAAGIAGIPSSLLLVLFSTRFGRLAARHGPRLYMAAGPAIMAIGLLWFVRLPSDSAGWVFGGGAGSSILPPSDYFVDLLPALLVFGAGLMMMVAPLTTALMTSVPESNAGVASAINNAISRVGSPLVTAVIFVAVASSFYASIGSQVPGTDVDSREFRADVAPLNQPAQGVSAEIRAAARSSSTDAFHLAMMVSAGLLLVGAAINAVGIRNPAGAGRRAGPGGERPPDREAAGAGGPVRSSPDGFGDEESPRAPTGHARDR
ncbi:MAG: MFS transporter [Actinomycetota bacterium]